MKKSFLFLFALFFIFQAFVCVNKALAEKVHGFVTCEHFQNVNVEEKVAVTYLIDGYIAGKLNNPYLNVDRITLIQKTVPLYCEANPDEVFTDAQLADFPDSFKSDDLPINKVNCAQLASADKYQYYAFLNWWTGYGEAQGLHFDINEYESFCESNPDSLIVNFIQAEALKSSKQAEASKPSQSSGSGYTLFHCENFSEDEQVILLLNSYALDGYIAGKKGPSSINFARVNHIKGIVLPYCEANHDANYTEGHFEYSEAADFPKYFPGTYHGIADINCAKLIAKRGGDYENELFHWWHGYGKAKGGNIEVNKFVNFCKENPQSYPLDLIHENMQ